MALHDPIYEEKWKERYKAAQRACNNHVEEQKKAERQVRDLVRDRDHWKERALIAEAALKSAGIK